MAEEGKVGAARDDDLPDQPRCYPRDLLNRFACINGSDESPRSADEDSGEIELGLGLSLGGCFGVDPKEKRLVRSSSIASIPFFSGEEELKMVKPVLPRTFSLPVETGEEQRQRKSTQSLRRMVVKRKRLEKRGYKPWGSDRAEEKGEEEEEEVRKGEGAATGEAKEHKAETEIKSSALHQGDSKFGMRNGIISFAQQRMQEDGWAVSGQPAVPAANGSSCFRLMPQGSLGSTGSCSTAASDLDNRSMQGVGSNTSIRKTLSLPSHMFEQKPPVIPAMSMAGKPASCTQEKMPDDSMRKGIAGRNGLREIQRSMMEQMPCVSAKGTGPNGRVIEGILYKYRKGEEVRIVCVCHGSFLTPAEFVKHAGGGDVAHPLRHIVVKPSSSSMSFL